MPITHQQKENVQLTTTNRVIVRSQREPATVGPREIGEREQALQKNTISQVTHEA